MLKEKTRQPVDLLHTIERLTLIRPTDLSNREISLLQSLGVMDDFERLSPVTCDIIRLGIPDVDASEAFSIVAKESPIPVVADIHFDPDLAIACVRGGAHKIRINPGNISDHAKLEILARECIERRVPIRVGVNAGSLEQTALERAGGDVITAAVDSALTSVRRMEDFGVEDLVVSIKASTAEETIAADKLLAGRCSYPLHVGVTEAGVGSTAIVHSWTGIGALLHKGIGDTIRISLTESPSLEVVCGHLLMLSLGLPRFTRKRSA